MIYDANNNDLNTNSFIAQQRVEIEMLDTGHLNKKCKKVKIYIFFPNENMTFTFIYIYIVC